MSLFQQVLQKRKSFPFGAALSSWHYVDPSQQRFRDFFHTHFNWAVPGNALKWRQFDWHQVGIGWLNSLEEQAVTPWKGNAGCNSLVKQLWLELLASWNSLTPC